LSAGRISRAIKLFSKVMAALSTRLRRRGAIGRCPYCRKRIYESFREHSLFRCKTFREEWVKVEGAK
jgi:hypothetical protein